MPPKRPGLAAARKAAGLSQEKLAYALKVECSTVQRWEYGESTPQPWVRPKLAAALRMSRKQLAGLLEAVPMSSRATDSVESGSVVTPKAAFGGVVLPALDADELHHVARALDDPRRFLDVAVIMALERQLDASMRDDGALGPTKTLPGVLGLLEVIDRGAREARPEVRRKLLSLGASGAEFAGWLFRDNHQPEWAAQWYGQAIEWAQEACDLPMQGYMLMKKSQMAYDQRDAVRVRSLADAAESGPWQLPVRVQAEVTQQTALGLAMTGEPLGDVQRKLEQAHTLLERANTSGVGPGELGNHFTTNTLGVRNAACLTEAGRPADAAVLFAEVLVGDGLSWRDRGFFTARRAAALALSGEPDEAARLGIASAEVAKAAHSERTLRVLVDVMQTLKPWSGRPGPRELREAISA